jgi:S1-C subfamily serine protease
VPNSVAAIAQLIVGDIVVKVNDEIVSDTEILADTVRLRNRAQQLSLQVLRGERIVTLYINSVL